MSEIHPLLLFLTMLKSVNKPVVVIPILPDAAMGSVDDFAAWLRNGVDVTGLINAFTVLALLSAPHKAAISRVGRNKCDWSRPVCF